MTISAEPRAVVQSALELGNRAIEAMLDTGLPPFFVFHDEEQEAMRALVETTEKLHIRVGLKRVIRDRGIAESRFRRAFEIFFKESALCDQRSVDNAMDVGRFLIGLAEWTVLSASPRAGSTYDVYRLDGAGFKMRVPREEEARMLRSLGVASSQGTTVRGGCAAWDVPSDLVTQCVLPPKLLMFMDSKDDIHRDGTADAFLSAHGWYVGSG